MTTIDLTPAGFAGPDAHKNTKRANKAVEEQAIAACNYMNMMSGIIADCGGYVALRDFLLANGYIREDADATIAELLSYSDRKKRADEELLRAIGGHPPAGV